MGRVDELTQLVLGARDRMLQIGASLWANQQVWLVSAALLGTERTGGNAPIPATVAGLVASFLQNAPKLVPAIVATPSWSSNRLWKLRASWPVPESAAIGDVPAAEEMSMAAISFRYDRGFSIARVIPADQRSMGIRITLPSRSSPIRTASSSKAARSFSGLPSIMPSK